ncbi:MAG: hypothetical protein ACREV7_15065 [Steroidobacteraceae bacterium]
MSIHITRSLSRVLPLAAAALFIQIGSAAAASPQGDIQQQMREVLTGSIATHAIPPSESDPENAARSNVDMQAFARQLLQGWSVSHLGRATTTKQKLQAEASVSSQKPLADVDFQSTVRRSLLGESASLRGAL